MPEPNKIRLLIQNFFMEEHQTRSGEKTQRVKSGIFYWASFWSFIIGMVLVVNEVFFGFALIMTACPALALYPLVRFLFGGKDSVWSAVWTFILEEFLKGKAAEIIDGKKRKRRH